MIELTILATLAVLLLAGYLATRKAKPSKRIRELLEKLRCCG